MFEWFVVLLAIEILAVAFMLARVSRQVRVLAETLAAHVSIEHGRS